MSFRPNDRVVYAGNGADGVLGTVVEVDRRGRETCVAWDGEPEEIWYDDKDLLPASPESLRSDNGLAAIEAPSIQHLEYVTRLDPDTGSIGVVRDPGYRDHTKKPVIQSGADIYKMWSGMQLLTEEHIIVGILDTRLRLLGWKVAHKGGIDSVEAFLRTILQDAFLMQGRAIVLLHNHPSGDPGPSDADKDLTRAVAAIGSELGLEVIDHVIVGRPQDDNEDGPYFSFREAGELPDG